MTNVSPLIVTLGSGSAIKIEAVNEAFASIVEQSRVKIVPVIDAVSGVRPQPIGKAETKTGARNRAIFAAQRHPGCAFSIGIENGMWEEDEGNPSSLVDGAFVVCLCISHNRQTAATDVLDEFVEQSDVLPIPQERPFPCGRNGEWSVLKDPHSVLTGGAKPRKSFLVPPLVRIAARIFA